MSAPSQPAGPAAAAAPATPVRVPEGTPNPERTFTLAQLKEYDGQSEHARHARSESRRMERMTGEGVATSTAE